MQGRTGVDFDFRDYELARKYLVEQEKPYPISYIIKNHKKEALNNEYYSEMKNFQYLNDKGSRVIMHKALRDYIIKKYRVVVVQEYPKVYFVWNGFYYTEVDESFLLSIFEKTIIDGEDTRGVFSNELKEFLTQFRMLERDKLETLLEKNRGWLPFKNGVLNTQTMEFTNHNPNLFFRFCIPYAYEIKERASSRKTENWDKLLNIILAGKQELINIVEFYIGYILSQEVSKNFQYFLAFIGTGNNGKSFFLDVIRNMLSPHLYTTAEITKMSNPDNRFSMATIENKILILNDDVSEEVFKNPDFIKRLVGGNETLLVERKNVDPYEIRITAKPIITMNQLPYMPDTTEGFQRRFLAVPLSVNVAKVSKDLLIRDPHGDKRMFVPEYPYIIKRCLELYHKQKENFTRIETKSEDIMEARKKIVGYSDALSTFFDDNLYFCGDDRVKIFCKDLFELYKSNFETNIKYQKKFNNFVSDLDVWAERQISKEETMPKSTHGFGVKRNMTSSFKYKLDIKKDELFVVYPEHSNSNTSTLVDRRTSGAFLTGFMYLSDWLVHKDEKRETNF